MATNLPYGGYGEKRVGQWPPRRSVECSGLAAGLMQGSGAMFRLLSRKRCPYAQHAVIRRLARGIEHAHIALAREPRGGAGDDGLPPLLDSALRGAA